MRLEVARKPSTGQLVRVRTRHWLVEDVQGSPAGSWVRLACVDDDAQGDTAEVIWEAELDREVLDSEAWAKIGRKGFDEPISDQWRDGAFESGSFQPVL